MRLDPSSGPARFFRRGLLVHRHRHERCEPKCGEETLIVKRTMSAGFTSNISCAILGCR